MNCHGGYVSISRDMIEDGADVLRKIKFGEIDVDWDIRRQRHVIDLPYCMRCCCYYAETEEQALIAVQILSLLLHRRVFWDCNEKKIVY